MFQCLRNTGIPKIPGHVSICFTEFLRFKPILLVLHHKNEKYRTKYSLRYSFNNFQQNPPTCKCSTSSRLYDFYIVFCFPDTRQLFVVCQI